MRGPDLDRERSEKKLSPAEFLSMYNEGLPADYPKATNSLLTAFTVKHPELFKREGIWSLDQHRNHLRTSTESKRS